MCSPSQLHVYTYLEKEFEDTKFCVIGSSGVTNENEEDDARNCDDLWRTQIYLTPFRFLMWTILIRHLSVTLFKLILLCLHGRSALLHFVLPSSVLCQSLCHFDFGAYGVLNRYFSTQLFVTDACTWRTTTVLLEFKFL